MYLLWAYYVPGSVLCTGASQARKQSALIRDRVAQTMTKVSLPTLQRQGREPKKASWRRSRVKHAR